MRNYPKLIYFLSEIMQLQNPMKLLCSVVCIFSMSMSTTALNQLGLDIDAVAAGDESGYSESLSSDGTRIAIGSPYNDGNGNNSGQLRIYETDDTN